MIKPLLVAEVKTKSPFGYQSSQSWEELFALANQFGDILSIHTDARWGGSFDILKNARNLTSKPILAKGIHATDEEIARAVSLGADYVLVVGRVPGVLLEKCWLEPNNLQELASVPSGSKVVWNSRDLQTGGLKKESFADARRVHGGWLCQASNLRTTADIYEGADAVLVGTNLAQFCASL